MLFRSPAAYAGRQRGGIHSSRRRSFERRRPWRRRAVSSRVDQRPRLSCADRIARGPGDSASDNYFKRKYSSTNTPHCGIYAVTSEIPEKLAFYDYIGNRPLGPRAENNPAHHGGCTRKSGNMSDRSPNRTRSVSSAVAVEAASAMSRSPCRQIGRAHV